MDKVTLSGVRTSTAWDILSMLGRANPDTRDVVKGWAEKRHLFHISLDFYTDAQLEELYWILANAEGIYKV